MLDLSREESKMTSYGSEFRNKIQRQKNKPDGKLFITDRLSFCPGALPMLRTIRSKRVLTPPGHPFFRSLLTSGLYRFNKSRSIRLDAVFCPCSLRNQKTNGINTFRTAETNVSLRTNEPRDGAREDIVQKDLCFCGAKADIKHRFIGRLRRKDS